MKKVVSALLLLLLVVACAPQAAPTPVPQVVAPAAALAPVAAVPVAPAKPVWQDEWDRVVAVAKAEGKLMLHTTGSQSERDAMVKGMNQAYGIHVEAIIGRGADLVPKFTAERRAGLFSNDVWVGGYTAIPLGVKAIGMVDFPLDSQLMLPDVTDPERIKKVWYQGEFPWMDKDHSVFITILSPNAIVAVNTELIKEGDLKSHRDLLDPKWKGKLIVNDPTISGGAQQALAATLKIMGEDFIRQMAKTEPIVMRDQRLMMEWLSHGKVAIVYGPDNDTLIQFVKAGAPVKAVLIFSEGGRASGGASGVALFNRAAHPNTAKVFINWITSKEGQELYARAGNRHSLRLDVSTAHLRPDEIRQPGKKYIDVSPEEFKVFQTTVAANLAKELFGPLLNR